MSLNVIGLISGGKDSLYSLAHCIQQGHKIVALANLYPSLPEQNEPPPANAESADLNSFMYQTVGHSLVHLYAQALHLPLYRHAITGSAVQTSQYYSHRLTSSTSSPPTGSITQLHPDEVNDMLALIQTVKDAHPDANALSAGAILSTYQRTRVESVAIATGLVPLAYLWQYPSLPPPPTRADSLTGLLDDMAHAGCDARVIKLASGGIGPEMLWSDVASAAGRRGLVDGLRMFYAGAGQEGDLRGAVLGEGGEYETLAIDGPGLLWKTKLAVETEETFEVEGVSYVGLKGGKVVDKEALSSVSEIPVPGLWDRRFQVVNQRVAAAAAAANDNTMTPENPEKNTEVFPPPQLSFSYSSSSSTLHLHNLTSSSLPTTSNSSSQPHATPPSPTDAPAQLKSILHSLPHLHPLSSPTTKITHITLLLASMADFPALNTIYTSHLWPSNLPVPPARVTVSAPLPDGVRVAVSAVFDLAQTSDGTQNESKGEFKGRGGQRWDRKGLHVQGRSYWAPANIGPYSQAVSSLMFPAPSFPRFTATTEKKGLDGDEMDEQNPCWAETVYMAGQIPLVPATMGMWAGEFAEQAGLALQHLWRVGQERKVDLWAGGVAYLKRGVGVGDVVVAAGTWRFAHLVDEKGGMKRWQGEIDGIESESEVGEEAEEIDVWHHQHNRGFTGGNITIGEHLHVLPNREILQEVPGYVPPLIAAEVESLPRDAPIEWWSTGLGRLAQHPDQVRVCTASTNLDEIRIRGTVVQRVLHKPDRSETETHRDRTRRKDKRAVLFLTLTSAQPLVSGIDEETVRQICKLVSSQDSNRNLELADPFVARVVSGYRFVNLSLDRGQAEPGQTAAGIGLTTVPCYHVWTSSENSQLQPNPSRDLPQIEEVAMAMSVQVEIEFESNM